MAEIKFTVAKAKDEAFTSEVEAATLAGATIDQKKGIVTLADNEVLGEETTVDVSESAFFKTIDATGYTGSLTIEGNNAVANTVSLGGGTNVVNVGGGGIDDSGTKPKVVTSADKIYAAADGSGANTYVYGAYGGKDAIYNFGDNDVIQLNLDEGQDISIVDKSGGIVVTIADSENATVAKNSVLTIDGKTLKNTTGYTFVNSDGETIYEYGKRPTGVVWAEAKKGGNDTTALIVNNSVAANTTIDAKTIASTIKTINAADASKAVHIIGNANANNITIGSGGGTIDGGNAGTKATNDNLYGTSGKAVTFVYDASTGFGGKDVIYNYKSSDNIIVNGEEITTTLKGSDAVITVDKNNTITVKNALGKAVNINGSVDENTSFTLPSGLDYDAKLSKITANDSVITSGKSTVVKRPVEIITTYGGEEVRATIEVDTEVYNPIYLGGENASGNEVTFEESVKDIDLSASSAPVIIDTSENASVTSVKVGKDGGTVTGNEATQTFTAGNGTDLFIIDASKIPSADADLKKFKGDTINGMGSGDKISIAGASSSDITFLEKGKDLQIMVNGATLITVKGFDSDTGLTVVDQNGTNTKYPKDMPTGLSYEMGKKLDKTSLVATGAFTASAIVAEDYGGATIKKINASAVTSAESLNIVGSDAANSLYAPDNEEASVDTTLNGGAGNDILIGSSLEGAGSVTYVFNAATDAKGKKADTIWNYKDGDLIVLNGLGDIEGTSLSEEGLFYSDTVNGFNDTKADVVVSLNKSNTITIKNAAGKGIRLIDGANIEDGDYSESDVITLGHVLPSSSLALDAKKTAVTLASDSSYSGDINLSDYNTYYNTIKKVDMTGNSVAVNIYGNTLANEFIAGAKGGILDGGSVEGLTDAKGNALKPTADKLTGGAGKDTFVYDVAYGKDSFLKFGNGDTVSLGAEITKDNLVITDKKNVVTVAITDTADTELMSAEKGAINTTANSTFTITKESDTVPIKFVGDGLGSAGFTYGALPNGVAIDTKYASLIADTSANVTVDASVINSQPKVIDAKKATGTALLIGNANADNIYAGSGGATLFGGTAGTKAVKDALYGGAGTDYFLFTSQDGAKGKESDIVYNYDSDTDVIVLDRAPSLVKADGKTVTFTFNDLDSKEKTVASTVVINGTASDGDVMKKFNPITSKYKVNVAIAEDGLYDEDGKLNNFSTLETTSYLFDSSVKDLKGGKVALEPGEDTGISIYGEDTGEEEEEQLAAGIDDYWFTEDNAAKIEVAANELDEILEVKGSTAAAAQFNADSYFTGIGDADQAAASALTYAARHQAKK